jgi:hypothetical protein
MHMTNQIRLSQITKPSFQIHVTKQNPAIMLKASPNTIFCPFGSCFEIRFGIPSELVLTAYAFELFYKLCHS